jgi:hypothetical protein
VVLYRTSKILLLALRYRVICHPILLNTQFSRNFPVLKLIMNTPAKALLIVFLCLGSLANAQRQTKLSRSELGLMVGGSYYIGDLNPIKHFKNTHLAGGIIYRFNIHSRLVWRSNFFMGSVEGSDEDAKHDVIRNRNLSFQSKLYEIGSGVEFNYFPFQIGHSRYRGTAYLLAELALVHMNPTTEYNGDQVELQPLGTEGQGTSLSNKDNYSLNQLAIPLGVGARISIGRRASFGVEYGIRFLFTDYLDDVGSYRYTDPATLQAENGPIAAALSNRSLNGDRFGRRGNTASRDWYTFFGATLTFRLGDPKNCHFQN